MVGVMMIHDVSNGVNAEVTFDCNKDKRGGFFSFGGEKKNEHGNWINRTDLLSIRLTDDSDMEIGKGEGSYLERVMFDGQDYWKVGDKSLISKWNKPTGRMIMPSDSELRADLQLIRAEKWEEAEVQK